MNIDSDLQAPATLSTAAGLLKMASTSSITKLETTKVLGSISSRKEADRVQKIASAIAAQNNVPEWYFFKSETPNLF